MVSLSYFGLKDKFTEKISHPLRGNIYYHKNVAHPHGHVPERDFCGDPASCCSTKSFAKSTKGKKENRFQPFRSSASTWMKHPSGIISAQIVQVPREHFLFSANITDRLPKKTRSMDSARFIVKTREMNEFFELTDDIVIQQFLMSDSCKRIADKYLLAMVFAYFKRADLSVREYSRTNFFIALYLANDVEEDEEEIKYEIFPWILGEKWKNKYPGFLKMRDALLRKIDYKAIISRRCCDEIMAIEPDNHLWKRERPAHHGGALRGYMKHPGDDGFPRGPHASPRYCPDCDASDSQYDSASPASTSWFISSRDSSPEIIDMMKTSRECQNDDIWPSAEE